MATPVVAGSAALVRQYFTDGFYPSGRATPADALTPSGALIKAVMIAGACPVWRDLDLSLEDFSWDSMQCSLVNLILT